MKLNKQVQELPFLNDIKGANGKVYVVGGAVRDQLLKKESKDLDLMVCSIKEDHLIDILQKYGSVNLVGKSFGIIKWKAHGSSKDVDIGLPRRDRKGEGNKHTDIIVEVDTSMSIQEELLRRDFTINSMAIDMDGKLIDPYGGLKDCDKGLIRMTNPNTFSDDPLRILRAVQFAARFNFQIERKTIKAITKSCTAEVYNQRTQKYYADWANVFEGISVERIVIELQKMVDRGVAHRGVKLMLKLDLVKVIAKKLDTYANWGDYEGINLKGCVETLAELIWHMCPAKRGVEWAKNLKCSSEVIKEIQFLESVQDVSNKTKLTMAIFEASNNGCTRALHTRMFDYNKQTKDYDSGMPAEKKRAFTIEKIQKLFVNGHLPKTLKEVEINGNDLIEFGCRGERIGEKLKEVVRLIMERKLENDKQEIRNYLSGLPL